MRKPKFFPLHGRGLVSLRLFLPSPCFSAHYVPVFTLFFSLFHSTTRSFFYPAPTNEKQRNVKSTTLLFLAHCIHLFLPSVSPTPSNPFSARTFYLALKSSHVIFLFSINANFFESIACHCFTLSLNDKETKYSMRVQVVAQDVRRKESKPRCETLVYTVC